MKLFELDKKTKDGELLHIDIEKSQNSQNEYTYILSATDKCGEELGFASFIMGRNSGYLHSICVREPMNFRRGIGTVMLYSVEDFLFLHDIKKLSGSFSPTIYKEHGYTYEKACEFYNNRGYEFDDDYFYGTTILKRLERLNYPESTLVTEEKCPSA